MSRTVTFTAEDLMALAVLCQVAEAHPNTLQKISERDHVKPEWLAGLVMRLEPLLED